MNGKYTVDGMRRKYTWFEDPGHAWLRVPMNDLRELGVADKISPYSYRTTSNALAYLEEDMDAGTFLNAAKAAGWEIEFEEVYEDPTNIRNMNSFFSDPNWKDNWKEWRAAA